MSSNSEFQLDGLRARRRSLLQIGQLTGGEADALASVCRWMKVVAVQLVAVAGGTSMK